MKVVSWIVGVFFALMAVAMLNSNESLSGFLILVAALLILPVTRKALEVQLQKKDDTVEVTNKVAFISGIALVIISGFFITPIEQHTPAIQPSVETVQNVPVKKKDTTPRVYIDEVNKLQQLTEQLVDSTYVPPYPSFKRFAQIKKNLERNMEPTCNYFDELVRSTGNNLSPHREDAIRCSDTVLSMMAVLFDIRDGDHNAIQAQREKLIIINTHLVKQLDEYRQTPEYKAAMKKYLVE